MITDESEYFGGHTEGGQKGEKEIEHEAYILSRDHQTHRRLLK
jgi:hypothetical protein